MAFPTILPFQKAPSLASDCPFSSRHVVRYSVVIVLVLSTPSFHTCKESWILTKTPPGISWSRNQVFPITSGVSCSGSEDHMQLLASRALPAACLYVWNPNLSCRLDCWRWVDDVLSFASRAQFLCSNHCVQQRYSLSKSFFQVTVFPIFIQNEFSDHRHQVMRNQAVTCTLTAV